jgi:3'5'-cyclic nucleotide phosphodiesterase
MAFIVKPVDRAELTSALQELRSRWPAVWPGLAHIYKACLLRLGHGVELRAKALGYRPLSSTSRRFDALLAAAMTVARLSERRCRSAAEPSYHNRLHTADTLICMAALLSQTTSVQDKCSENETRPKVALRPDQSAFMLLVMLCHDVLHRGKINRFPFENELHTIEYILPVLKRQGVALSDQNRLKHLIIHTDPAICSKNHQKTIPTPLSLDNRGLQQVLVNQADISASVLPELAQSQGHALADEWNDDFPDLAAGVRSLQGRLYFLENIAIFSSPQAHTLGLHSLRSKQVYELRTMLGNDA